MEHFLLSKLYVQCITRQFYCVICCDLLLCVWFFDFLIFDNSGDIQWEMLNMDQVSMKQWNQL